MPSNSAAVSPFTGRPADPAPVLAVKIGNTKAARPHTGLQGADLVYLERVEGGLSRLCAVYASAVPDRVGPVRSAREHNVAQLRAFTRPALAYSGAQPGVDGLIKASPLFPLSNDDFPDGYHRDHARESPNNLYLNPRAVLAAAPCTSESADIGLVFADTAPDGGTPTDKAAVHYPSTTTSFTWDAEASGWRVHFDGEPATADGRQLTAATVVIQKADMPPSDYQDPTGTTPCIETVGEGEATVLRDGRAYETTWHRKTEADGTTYTRPDGSRMPFAPGQTWIAYDQR